MEYPKAFLFDLDGVITDTAQHHYNAWKKLCDELGLSFNLKGNERLKGISRLASLSVILELNNCAEKYTAEQKEHYADIKNETYKALLIGLTSADILPGVQSFIEEARAAGIKLAVASASKNAPMVLNLLGLTKVFDYIADASKIGRAKPDPEVFLNCAAALNVPPRACVGFEDAAAGIEAIRAAGMFSVGINVAAAAHAPSLSLKSTQELKLERVLAAWRR